MIGIFICKKIKLHLYITPIKKLIEEKHTCDPRADDNDMENVTFEVDLQG